MITEVADFTVKRGDAITTLSVKVNFKNTAERIPLADLHIYLLRGYSGWSLSL